MKASKIELQERLLEQGDFSYTAEELADLFDQDKGHKVRVEDGASHSLHRLVKEIGGVEALARGLQTNLVIGIEGGQADLKRRQEKFGDNRRIPREIKSLWEIFVENFEDFILKVLIAAAAVSLILGIINEGLARGWIEGVSIFIAIAIILIVNTSQNYLREQQFQELQNKQDVTSARVTRNGKTMTVDAEELVVGDMIWINSGDCIPADCVAVQAQQFSANESAITGESVEIQKDHATEENYSSNPNPFLLQNSLAKTGEATSMVLAVGHQTRSGRAGRIMNIASTPTPLQEKLEAIADLIGKMGYTMAILTGSVMIIKMLVVVFVDETRPITDRQNLSDLLNAFIIGVTIIVVAVPEGLPLAVTISLAFSVAEMANLGNLVRRLSASETMGGADQICTDKTGTLTQNNMTVQAFYSNERTVEGESFNGLMESPSGELIAQAVLYNSSAFIEEKENPRTKKVEPTVQGNVTECGLIKYLMRSGVPCEHYISNRKTPGFKKFDVPFTSSRKRATTVVQLEDGTIRVFVKGAPEILIQYCDNFLGADGEKADLDEDKKYEIISQVVKGFADQTYRTILISYIDFSANEWATIERENNGFESVEDKETVEAGLTMIGIFGLVDPLRPGIADAVDICHAAGVTVRMCTGDNIDTATAISKKAHILNAEDIAKLADPEQRKYICMTGSEFREACGGLNTEQDPDGPEGTMKSTIANIKAFREIKKDLKVLARSQPEDKFMLVTGLQQEQCVVAVTGDGNNDVPALTKADIGFAMGIAGTEVCKNASDIVLTNDDFCTITVAIKYGRNIYDNVRKFLQFQLTVNVAAMFIVFAGAILLTDEALTPVQMLWVNLIMDTLAALALATEPPSEALLNRNPHKRNDKIINAIMWRNIVGHAIYQIAVLLTILFWGAQLFNLTNYDDAQPFFVTKFWAEENQYSTNINLYNLANNALISGVYNTPTDKCVLYTLVFQCFVMMTIFNIINARKLGEFEYNVFTNFFNNFRFLLIFAIIFGGQIWMIQNGGQVVRTSGLTLNQHYWCTAIGAFSLIWALIVKAVMPASWFASLAISEAPMTEEQSQSSMVSSMRKSFRQSIRRQQTSGSKVGLN